MTPYLSQNAYWLGPVGVMLFILIVSRYWLKPFFWRVFLSVVPLGLAAIITSAAWSNLNVIEYLVQATDIKTTTKPKPEKEEPKKDGDKKDEPKKEEPKERLDRQVDFNTEDPVISLKDVRHFADEWYQKQKRIATPSEWYRVEGVGEADGDQYKTVRFTFGVPESAQSVRDTRDLVQSILDGLNETKVRFRFNLGVDLAGGTILEYQEIIDPTKKDKPRSATAGADLAAALKRRIDPANLMEITIRPLDTNPPRVEITLPMRSAKGRSQGNAAVERVKSLIRKVGSLEFRILADSQLEAAVLEDARNLVKDVADIEKLPAPAGYEWKEFDEKAVQEHNWSDTTKDGFEMFLSDPRRGTQLGVYHAANVNRHFVLTKIPDKDAVVTGEDLQNAQADIDRDLRPIVTFSLHRGAGERMQTLTSPVVNHYMATILDNKVSSFATIINPLRDQVQVTMGSGPPREVQRRVDELVRVLKAGALPTTLDTDNPTEQTMGPGLGQETINKGTFAIGTAFLAVVVFMIIYYRFAGMVASVALLANLLLTIGFMVAVKAVFTLPGLAGLVLTLGMAVDANVLIYERIREERERGAGLALAIRNGYDRAFPTIIDTHLTSIFTAIVLYIVGNYQLKGFGIMLTVGLIISLFTALFMTRLLFDIFLAKGILTKLSMMRFLTKTNIDFMGIRKAVFTITVALSIAGLAMFLGRGEDALDIEFTRGTLYHFVFKKEVPAEQVYTRLADAKAADGSPAFPGFKIDGAAANESKEFTLRTTLKGANGEPAPDEVRRRIAALFGNELVYVRVQAGNIQTEANAQLPMTTILTAEETPELVDPNNPKSSAKAVIVPDKVRDVVREWYNEWFNSRNQASKPEEFFQVEGIGKPSHGQYEQVRIRFALPEGAAPSDSKALIDKTLAALNIPYSQKLAVFKGTAVQDIQEKAIAAILLSWLAICMYLWFRFGNWTFGLAAVLCLIHDLLFAIGIFAGCHYLAGTAIGNVLLLEDFKLDLTVVAALLTLVGYSVNDTIVVFDRIREVRGKSPELTPQMINDSINQTLSRTLLTALTVWLVVVVLYIWGGEGVHPFSFVMVIGVIIGTYSSIYVASPLLLIFGEGKPTERSRRSTLQEAAARE